jgi:hypothetical protein
MCCPLLDCACCSVERLKDSQAAGCAAGGRSATHGRMCGTSCPLSSLARTRQAPSAGSFPVLHDTS